MVQSQNQKAGMNLKNSRRRRIREIIAQLASGIFSWDDIQLELEDIKDEEEEAKENTPESFQDTENYRVMEESVEYLEEALDYIDPDDKEAPSEIIKVLRQIDGV